VQRRTVHKLRNLERKAPQHALAEIRADFHRIVYAESAAAARAASTAFERKWARAVRVTQGGLPTEDAALVLLFGLVVSG
jgi:transposase-like protein